MKYHLKNAERIAKLLDSKFNILGLKFGIEPLIGAIPIIGDNITFIMSLYLVWIGVKMSIPKKELQKMTLNILVDYVVGIIPIFGDVADFFYKANDRNFKILSKYA